MMGTTAPFARNATERQAQGDPRPSIGERYRDRDAVLAQARAAAEKLAARGLIVQEDVDVAVELAVKRYDALVPQAVGVR
jgi:hypothetical protein